MSLSYPQFIENREFFQQDNSKSQTEQILALAANVKKIYELTTSTYSSFESLIKTYLQSGIAIFDMKIGIVSRIEGDKYHICQAQSPDNSLKSGDQFELEGTYCREVIRTNSVLGFPHVGEMEELKNHPVYKNMKLESYISSPIYLKGEIFGTLNFSSTEKRSFGFSESERDLISLMAASIGNYLYLQEKEKALVESNDRMKKLVGQVAHDLRNPVGAIIGMTELIEPHQHEDSQSFIKNIEASAEEALEIIHSILEMAAMGTGKVKLAPERVRFDELISASIKQVETQFSAKGVTLSPKIDKVTVEIDPKRMKQVIMNLLTNAAKYTKTGSEVNLILSTANGIEFMIENEKSNKVQENDFDVKKSVGYGLEIIKEIVEMHKSELEIEEKNNRFKVSFKLSDRL